MLFYFCIVVYNGAEHILLLDFLWAHPNSFDWPIKSSGPNNVCNVWYIYIYKCKGRFLLLGLKKEHALHTRLESTHELNLGCRKGRAHWTQIFMPPRTEHILRHQWSTKMAFYDINQGKHFIYCHLMHALMSTCDPMSFKISSMQSYLLPSK